MKDDPIIPAHHVVHYVGPGKLQDGEVDGSAFMLRTADVGDGLSANWLEFFSCSKQEQIERIRALARIGLNKNGMYAELNVGETCDYIRQEIADFAILQDPLAEDTQTGHAEDGSHSLLKNLPDPANERAQLIGDMIAQKVKELHPMPNKKSPDQA